MEISNKISLKQLKNKMILKWITAYWENLDYLPMYLGLYIEKFCKLLTTPPVCVISRKYWSVIPFQWAFVCTNKCRTTWISHCWALTGELTSTLTLEHKLKSLTLQKSPRWLKRLFGFWLSLSKIVMSRENLLESAFSYDFEESIFSVWNSP